MQTSLQILQSNDFITTIAYFTDNLSLCALRSTCHNLRKVFDVIIKKYIDKWHTELFYMVFHGGNLGTKFYKKLSNEDDDKQQLDFILSQRGYTSSYSCGRPIVFVYKRQDLLNIGSHKGSPCNCLH